MNQTSNIMLLYKDVTVVSREDHRKLRIKPIEGFEYAASTHWLPLAGVEFFQASHHYPIIFASEQREGKTVYTPILLVGLKPGTNDYVDSENRWKAHSYLPAFVRRYPFVLAEAPDNAEELMVCFDAGCDAFSETEGVPLFNEDGTPSEMMDNIMQFMNGFAVEMRRTRQFVEMLEKLDLLENRSIQIRGASGSTFNLTDFLTVNEDKFNQLKDKDVLALFKAGFLGWIYAHLTSMNNLPQLLEMHQAKNKA